MRLLLQIVWLFAILYATIPSFWLLIHPFAGYWRARKQSPFRLLLPLWLVIMVAAAALTWRWRLIQIYSTPLAWIPAGILFLAAIRIYRSVHSGFGRANLIGQTELRSSTEQRLVTSGLHARMRHPV